MNPTRLFLAAALALPVAACNDKSISAAPSLQSSQVGDTIVLAIGGSATVAPSGLRLTLRSIDNDSRCPTDVVCVWAGDAHAAIAVDPAANAPAVQATLHTTLTPRFVDVGANRIELVDLSPQPHSGRQLPKSEYRAKFVVKAMR